MAEVKPESCECAFPAVKARNPSLHAANCPCFRQWFAKQQQRAADPRVKHGGDERAARVSHGDKDRLP